MRVNKWIVAAVLMAIALVAVWAWQRHARSEKQESLKEIRPVIGTIETFISTTGSVLPRNRLEVRPPVNGRVEQVLVKEGDNVKAGQVVAWMSSTDRAALLDAARGQSGESLKHWQEAYRPIALVAPIDGQVIVSTTQSGQTVTTTDPVVVLSDRLIFRAQVDETDIAKIRDGQEAVVTLDAYPGTKINARVDHVYYESSRVNNVTIYNVDLQTEEMPAFCRSGMSVTVNFRGEHKEDVLTLPVSAVRKGKDGAFVLLRVPETLRPVRRAVQLGISDDAVVEIVSGVTVEDRVLVKDQKLALPKAQTGTNPFAPQQRRTRGGGH